VFRIRSYWFLHFWTIFASVIVIFSFNCFSKITKKSGKKSIKKCAFFVKKFNFLESKLKKAVGVPKNFSTGNNLKTSLLPWKIVEKKIDAYGAPTAKKPTPIFSLKHSSKKSIKECVLFVGNVSCS
jgi:hypothetical protein